MNKVNFLDLPTKEEAWEAALAGNPITFPIEEDEVEIFYLDNDEEPDNREEFPEFTNLYLENTWYDIEPFSLNYTMTNALTDEKDNSELDSEIQKGARTIQELEII